MTTSNLTSVSSLQLLTASDLSGLRKSSIIPTTIFRRRLSECAGLKMPLIGRQCCSYTTHLANFYQCGTNPKDSFEQVGHHALIDICSLLIFHMSYINIASLCYDNDTTVVLDSRLLPVLLYIKPQLSRLRFLNSKFLI